MTSIVWQEKTVALKDLRPYERNPRRISKEAFNKLKQSIEQDGFHQRILCTPEFKVIGGHQRIKALKELGWKDVQVLTPSRELTEDEYRRLLIRDNLQAGEWDMDELANAFTIEELKDWGFPENLLPSQEGVVNEPEGDEDAAPEAPAIAQTVRGDVYTIGTHRLMCGDSTLIDDVDKLMDGAKADMVFTDPPYGVDYKGINNDDRAGLETLLDLSFSNMLASSKSGSSCYVFHSDKCADIFHSVFRRYFHFSSMIIWAKNSLTLSRTDYQSKHEPCLYGWMNNGSHVFYGDRKQTSIWEVHKERAEGHTTPKPIELIEKGLNNSSKGGDIVLDLFGGSGSTMVAAHKLGRTAYLMELDEKYCDVIVQRMHKLFPDLPITRNGMPFTVKVQ
jgi:DNA modification methylase